jgi:voltage-gated potassium channel
MLGGIALLGTVTATLASWIVQRVAEEDIAGQVATAQQVAALVEQVEQLPDRLRPGLPAAQLAGPPRRRRRRPKVRTGIRPCARS